MKRMNYRENRGSGILLNKKQKWELGWKSLVRVHETQRERNKVKKITNNVFFLSLHTA